MAVHVPTTSAWVYVGDIYGREVRVNVTYRDPVGCELLMQGEALDEDVQSRLGALVSKTVRDMMDVIHALDGSDPEPLSAESPEKVLDMELSPDDGDPVVTVWCEYRKAGATRGATLTMTSNTSPLYLYRAARVFGAGLKGVGARMTPIKSKSEAPAPEPSVKSVPKEKTDNANTEYAEAPNKTTPAPKPHSPVPDYWEADQRINYNDRTEVQYRDKQIVGYSVNTITLTRTNAGTPVVKLKSDMGTLTVFVNSRDGSRSYDYRALIKNDGSWIAEKLEALLAHGEKSEREGDWLYLVKIAHVRGEDGVVREYKNAQALYRRERDLGKLHNTHTSQHPF